MKMFGIKVIMLDSKKDIAIQVGHIEQFITQRVDAIALCATSVEGIVPVLQKANRAKIPVFCVLDAAAAWRLLLRGIGI